VCISSEESEGCIYSQLWYIYKGFKEFCSCLPCPLIFLNPSEASEASEASESFRVSLALKREDDF